MPCEVPPYSLITFWSGALVAIVTAVVGHFLAAWRERGNRKHGIKTAKENRKQDFIGLMSGMRAEAERILGDDYAFIFATRLYEVRRESPKVRRDLSSGRQLMFDKAVETLGRLTDSEVCDRSGGDKPEGRRRVTEAIDAVVTSLG